MIRDADQLGDIEHAADPDRRVDHETAQRIGRELRLALQHVVREDQRIVQILQEIRGSIRAPAAADGAVGLRDRHQDVPVDRLVEREDAAVGIFKRIVEFGNIGPLLHWAGASAENQK